jgi:hypothetical protein
LRPRQKEASPFTVRLDKEKFCCERVVVWRRIVEVLICLIRRELELRERGTNVQHLCLGEETKILNVCFVELDKSIEQRLNLSGS